MHTSGTDAARRAARVRQNQSGSGGRAADQEPIPAVPLLPERISGRRMECIIVPDQAVHLHGLRGELRGRPGKLQPGQAPPREVQLPEMRRRGGGDRSQQVQAAHAKPRKLGEGSRGQAGKRRSTPDRSRERQAPVHMGRTDRRARLVSGEAVLLRKRRLRRIL